MRTTSNSPVLTRRRALATAAAALTVPAVARAQPTGFDARGFPLDPAGNPIVLERRVSGFLTRDWQDHFSNRRNGVILVDTAARALHFWNEAGTIYNVYPTSVPLTPELTRTGRTRIVQKRIGPDWRPTPNMLRRNPDLPTYVGPGPQNPLGTHALYLSWTYYRIHGTNDTRKIGRKSSNGCIGLYNEQIEELFGLARVGTQDLLI